MFPVVIRSDKVELREMEAPDAAAVAEMIADEAVLRYTTWKGATDVEAAKRFVRTAQETAATAPRVEYLLSIAYLPTGEVVGTCGIRLEDAGAQVGSLRCLVRRDWWGRGVATEATKSLIHFGFETMGLRRIEADPANANAAALTVLERAGMRRLEGLPEHDLAPGGVLRDSVRFAILREDLPP